MALVIISAGKLARSSLRTVTTRVLVAVTGALALAGVAGGFALGFRIGGTTQKPAAASLDPDQPGSQALIREIGSLSGRLMRLEAVADRLTERVGTKPPAVANAAGSAGNVAHEPAGGPLVAAPAVGEAGTDASLAWLDQGLEAVEGRLDGVASMIARRDLDGMAFPSRKPIPGIAMSSGFGRRLDPFTRRPAQHAGFDYTAPYGTTVLASAGGQVRRAGPYGAYGKTVEIDHGDGLVTRYGHLSRILVRAGDILLPGQPIAMVGSTGRSTGAHLHFEILRDGKQVHPDLYLTDNDG